jgi:hypothetical protein
VIASERSEKSYRLPYRSALDSIKTSKNETLAMARHRIQYARAFQLSASPVMIIALLSDSGSAIGFGSARAVSTENHPIAESA